MTANLTANRTAIMHVLAEASVDAERHQHLRHGYHHPMPWVYAAWMCMLLLAVCVSLRFMVEDIVRSSKAAARQAEEREARAALQADAAERGACMSETEGEAPQQEREFFAANKAACEGGRSVEVVVHWTPAPPRASVPMRRSRSSGSGSPVTPA